MATKTITVKTDEENPEPVEIIAEAIIEISKAMGRINNGRLSKRAIILLIHDNCEWIGKHQGRHKPSQREIEAVLDSISSLQKAYVKQLPAKK